MSVLMGRALRGLGRHRMDSTMMVVSLRVQQDISDRWSVIVTVFLQHRHHLGRMRILHDGVHHHQEPVPYPEPFRHCQWSILINVQEKNSENSFERSITLNLIVAEASPEPRYVLYLRETNKSEKITNMVNTCWRIPIFLPSQSFKETFSALFQFIQKTKVRLLQRIGWERKNSLNRGQTLSPSSLQSKLLSSAKLLDFF